MKLAAVTRGKVETPQRILLFGVEGIGKSTWAAAAPSPIFLPAEEGSYNLDVARFPQPQTWQEVIDAVGELTDVEHNYQTLVIDTLDALEALCWAHICKRDGKASIEAYGYGKGYIAAVDEWRVFLSAIERLRAKKRMSVVLIAHSWIKPFKNPIGEDFDRFELKLHAKAGGLLKEWSDAVLFAHWDTETMHDPKTGAAKGYSAGARIVSTVRTAAWDAKNRHSMPAKLPLNFDDFAAAMKAHRPADPAKLKTSIAAKVAKLGDSERTPKIEAAVKAAGDDAAQLAKIDDRLTALVAEREGA